VYEDDGHSVAYATSNAFAFTNCTYSKSSSSLSETFRSVEGRLRTSATSGSRPALGAAGIHVSLSTTGTYLELPATRTYVIRLPNWGPPESITVSGGSSGSIPFSRWGKLAIPNRAPTSSYWSFDGDSMSTEIVVVGVSTATGLELSATLSANAPSESDFDGVGGIIRRSRLAKHALDEVRSTYGAKQTGNDYIEEIAHTAQLLGFAAGADPAEF